MLAGGRLIFKEIGGAALAGNLEADPENPELALARMFLRQQVCFTGTVQLNHDAMHTFVESALKKNDIAFFKALGRELERIESDPPSPSGAFDPLSKLLVTNWTAWRRTGAKLPGLNRLSEDSLVAFCSVILGEELSEDAVKKARQRLGLNPAKGKKIHLISINGRLKQV